MFINSKKTYEFPHPDGLGKLTTIPADYLGPVADWITETKLFELAVKEGSITIAAHEKIIPGAPVISNEERDLREKAKAFNIEHANDLPLIGLALLVYEAENQRSGDSDDIGADEPSAGNNDTPGLVERLEAMDADSLRAFAAQKGIALGNATTESGIRKKILDTLS